MRAEAVDCALVADAMARIVDGNDRADRVLVRHVEECLRCQAELARYRRLLRLLRQLRDQRPPVGAGPLQQALVGIEARAGTRMVRVALDDHRRPGAALVAAALAGAALVVVGVVAVAAGAGRPRAQRRPGVLLTGS